MSLTKYNKQGVLQNVLVKDDFKVIELFKGEYAGDAFLKLNTNNVEDFSEIIFITTSDYQAGVNSNIITIHPIPTSEFLNPTPNLYYVLEHTIIHLYKTVPNEVYVMNFQQDRPGLKIVKILGIMKP